MSKATIYRRASSLEADQLTELAVRSKAYWGYSKAFIEACRKELAVSPQLIETNGYHYVVAECDSEILGYYALVQHSNHEFELEAMFVAPKHIGKGVGTALMIHAKRLAQREGGNRILIQSDPNAEAFYLAVGAKPIGSRESSSISGRMLPLLSIALARENTV